MLDALIASFPHIATVRGLLARSPVVALLGARQVGKTTLARQIAGAAPRSTLFDLERAADVVRLADPELPGLSLEELGIGIPAATLERFWAMLAHYHGQVWNASEFGRSFGVSHHAVGRYLDALEGTFMLRVLRPWFENLGKRQVKSPKVYVRDSGLLHTLLDIEGLEHLERHPKVGASWEGFVLEAVVQRLGARADQCYFWATHTGAELDLLVVDGSRRYGFEIKRTTAPALTPSIRSAVADLFLTRLDVIHAGRETFPLAGSVRAVAARRLLEDVDPLRG